MLLTPIRNRFSAACDNLTISIFLILLMSIFTEYPFKNISRPQYFRFISDVIRCAKGLIPKLIVLSVKLSIPTTSPFSTALEIWKALAVNLKTSSIKSLKSFVVILDFDVKSVIFSSFDSPSTPFTLFKKDVNRSLNSLSCAS